MGEEEGLAGIRKKGSEGRKKSAAGSAQIEKIRSKMLKRVRGLANGE